MALFTETLTATTVGVADLELPAQTPVRVTQAYTTTAVSGEAARASQVYATVAANASEARVTQLYVTVLVESLAQFVCPAIAAPVATILPAKIFPPPTTWFLQCDAIAAPVADILVQDKSVLCPAIATGIAICQALYIQHFTPFTGGGGLGGVLPRRRVTVNTAALKRRRRRTARPRR